MFKINGQSRYTTMLYTVFENHRKSLIVTEVSYGYILSGQRLIKNAKNGPSFCRAFQTVTCGQRVLPDRSLLIRQKLVENVKIQKLKCNILSNFQTLWSPKLVPSGDIFINV